MVNSKAVRQALYTALNVKAVTQLLGSGSASICHAVAPSSAAYPLVIFNKQSSQSQPSFGGDRLDSELWLVKAVVQGGSSSAAEDVAAAVDGVLHWKTLAITGGESLHLARESGLDFSEIQDGEQYRHHGSVYRLIIH